MKNPLRIDIRVSQKVEITNLRNLVQTSRGHVSSPGDRVARDFCIIAKSLKCYFAEGCGGVWKCHSDWFRGLKLFGYDVLNTIDVFKKSNRLLIFRNITRNSDSWFASRSVAIRNYFSMWWFRYFFRRDAVVWSHKSLKTSSRFWKAFGFVTVILAI